MQFHPSHSAGTLTTATYDLGQHIHAAGYSTALAVIHFGIPDSATLTRLSPDKALTLKQAILAATRASLRQGDGIYVLGPWEWLCILPNLFNESAGLFAMQKISRALEETYVCLEIEDLQSLTFGLAFLHGGGSEADYLIQSARIAMNTARSEGKLMAVYAPAMETSSDRTRKIDRLLRAALASNDQIELLLQPKVDLANGHCLGAEALPVLRQTSGRPFALAETEASVRRQGLAPEFRRWLFNQLARTQATLQESGIETPLSVNLDSADLSDPELPELIEQILALHGISPASIVIEINGEHPAADVLRQLHALGLSFALDNFGAGQADLRQLQILDIQEIKMAAPLIQGLGSDERADRIVSALMTMAGALGTSTLALGVDSAEIRLKLAALGCTRVQGNWIAAPQTRDEFIAWWHARSDAGEAASHAN